MRVPHNLDKFWFLIDTSPNVPVGRPLRVKVLEKNLVVFRDAAGRPSALEDRCIHRHISLSSGRVDKGCVVCPYHGLAFNGDGACVVAPPLVDARDLPRKRVRAFPAIERDGCVWVNLADDPAAGLGPFESPWPSLDASYRSFELSYSIPSSVESILENFVDTSHTGELHRGMFRGGATKTVEVVVRRNQNHVSIETIGEKGSDSILSKLLNPRGLPVEHTDQYAPPYAVRVDYRFGTWHVVTTSVCRPIAPFDTFIVTRVYVNAGPLTRAVIPVLKRYTNAILEQDVQVLTDHGQQVQRYDHPKDVALKTDIGVVQVLRAYEAFLAGENGPEAEVVHRFSMRL